MAENMDNLGPTKGDSKIIQRNENGNKWELDGKIVVPYFHTIQKMVLYETKSRFYLVGSNQSESKFRLLKIDRTDSKELQLVEDPAHYNSKEMKELLATIACVNRSKTHSINSGGLVRTVSAFGVLGFVRFLEGYYIILVTKRRKVATIGHHLIYKIEDTACIYIPNEGPPKNPDELRYLKLFQSIDLSSNFYFSYSYDLTNTLQYNMTEPNKFLQKKSENPEIIAGYGVSNFVNPKFVWNSHLLKNVKGVLHPDWILHIIHAFIGQSNICVYGKPIYLTLIARRSAEFAGTRFLKRGANFQGHVANEVETEQIVFDASVSSFKRGRYTSFVQMRGSIPAHWSQDTAKMVAKPPIGLDIADPYAETAGKHFGELLRRFGSPLVVLNLVKKRERRKHESILTEEYVTAIKTLNQFLPPAHRIHYIGFDMAKTNKMKEADVMSKLARISEDAISKTKFFQSHQLLPCNSVRNPLEDSEPKDNHGCFGQRQTGLVRVNCVDCLDRTNTAQFALGKCALVHQLHALGVLDEGMHLEFESDAIRMLEELYEDHGDTLALQYGGSQLVHRINTYRKTAPWTSQGNDIMQTLSRYYSNTFSDADKQNAINLFLGVFQPSKEPSPLWTLENDIHLHLKPEFRFTNAQLSNLQPITEWYSDDVMKSLPNSCHELEKTCLLLPTEDVDDLDSYSDFFKTRFFVPLLEIFALKISHSVRDFMPHFTTEFSPFVVRVRPGKRQEEATSNKKIKLKNPSIMGLTSSSSGASATSTSSEESDYSSSEELNASMTSSNFAAAGCNNWTNQQPPAESGLSFSKLFPTMKESYGVDLKAPRKSDISLYKRFVHMQQIPAKPLTFPSFPSLKSNLQVIPLSGFSKDSCYRVTPPTVSKVSTQIYRGYVQRGITGAHSINQRDLSVYKRYVNQCGNPSQIIPN